MAATSDYQAQLSEAAALVMAAADPQRGAPWSLVFQSRSGPLRVPWLEPDIGDHLRSLAAGGTEAVVVAPIGFVADHLEVAYDLDFEAAQLARQLGLTMVRAATAGTHPAFVAMIRQLVEERLDPAAPRLALGSQGAYHDHCVPSCCPPPPPHPAGPARPALPAQRAGQGSGH
jgi:ferrochelatase